MSEKQKSIWVFDENYRVYAKDQPFGSGPIYREHWREKTVVGETSRSWILCDGKKVAKKGDVRGIAFSLKEVEDDVWIHDNKYRIARRVEDLKNVDTLRDIARIIDYQSQS